MPAAGLDNVADVYPLSPMQEGMLFHTIAEPGSGVFVDQISIELAGEMDVAAFRAAWEAVVARHATLRTAFLWDGLDEPLQVVREHVELDWSEADWSASGKAEASAWLARDRARGFDLAAAPLMRLMLVRTAPDAWRLVWTLHHLVGDGWSAQVVLDEVFAVYAERRGGPPASLVAPFRYRDFIAWHGQRDRAAAERFWRDRLAGLAAPTRLEVPGIPPIPDDVGHRSETITFDAATTARLRATAATERVTLNTVVLGAWAVLLGRWQRARDVVFGVTTAGRPPQLAGIEAAVGLFINTLPLRVDVDPARPTGDWLRGLQRRQLEQRDFEHTALADVQRWSDRPAGEPLFESIFVFENYPASADRGSAGLAVRGMDFVEQSNYPLAVLVLPGDELAITLVYDAARFGPAAVGRLADRFAVLLRQLIDGVARPVSELAWISPEECEHLAAWAEGPTPSTASPETEEVVHALIERAARVTPDAPAVTCGGRTMSYAALDAAAERVAGRLRAAGVGPDRPVGLHVPRSMDLVVGILGILKAGGAYVPLDPAYPPAHVSALVEEDGIDIVLAPRDRAGALPRAATLVALDDDDPASPDPGVPAPVAVGGDHLAYVIHTSGSTGRPKGVMVTHRNLLHSTLARTQHYGRPPERFLLLSSFAFDSSVAGIFWTLCGGGTLVLPEPGVEHDVDRLLALVTEQRVTHLLALPALYELMLEAARADELASLDVAIVAGEACPSGVARAHAERRPDAALYNEYGPTEATVWCSAYRIEARDASGPVPIGRPIPGARLHVLDHLGDRVPVGFVGELHVGGAGVARGYLNRPDLTDERFVTREGAGERERVYRTGDLVCHRPDGTLLFLGRADAQVKVRGHRIEIAAVEAALRELPSVTEAAVAARTAGARAESGRRATTRLVAYVEPDDPGAFDPVRVRDDLKRRRPDFMVPDVIVPLAHLPRRPNGKIDYRALPDPATLGGAAADGYVAPRNDTERVLAGIFSELLGVRAVGVNDDYFALGGDSIISIQLISRARQAGVHIEPGQVATHPTVAQLAAVARAAAAGAPGAPNAAGAAPLTGAVPLGPIQRWFFEADLAAPSHWNQSALFEVPVDLDATAFDEALRACLDHHDMLRARFEERAGRWQQTVEPGPAASALEVVDLGGDDPAACIADRQARLDIELGPLLRAVLMRRGADAPALLLLAVHHLVIDVVSWSILVGDLETAYRQRRAGDVVTLPPRTTSFRDWIARLAEEDRTAERAVWATRDDAGPLPTDRAGGGAGTEGTTRVLRVELDVERTRALLGDANDAYRTRAEDLLITALAQAVGAWTGADALRVGLEGHGRPDDAEGVDLSRTVGWFTAYYPLTLRLGVADDPGAVIKSIKEQLRAVPRGGVGYGALRYLDRDPEIVRQPAPALLFNYLSRVRRRTGDGVLTWVSAEQATSRDAASGRAHPIEVVAAVRDDRLAADWYYSEASHDRATVERVAEGFVATLERLLEHCGTGAGAGFTPSDFPEAGLDQAELDRFLDELAP